MKERILVVDDEADIRLLFSAELKAAGYEVFEAENGDDCYSILKSEKIDVCLLDIKLKNESGIDILHKITAEYPKVRTIMCTAYSAFQDDLSTWQADSYWVKSQDLDSLKNEIEKVLSKKK